jgi:uncharacterized protein YhjY with autotransporter beta-barrel domain
MLAAFRLAGPKFTWHGAGTTGRRRRKTKQNSSSAGLFLKRSSLICGVSSFALLAGMARVALADNLTVSGGTNLTTPLSTATASNNSPGNITTELGSNVTISEPGAAFTINSNNSIEHGGTAQSLANSGAIGVHILGGFAGNFTAQGSAGAIVNVTGSGTGNYGLLLDGASAFTGNINFQPGSAIIVYGENSVGVAIDAQLIGNLTTGAGLQATGVGATGVKITREITGTYINSGPISVRGTSVYTAENVDPLSGSGIAIGASIGMGFLNSGPVSGSDSSTATGRVTNSSTAPAVIIAPSVAGASAGNITLNAFAGDTASLAFSFMNRGNITASENDTGISTTGVQLGETSATGLTVLLTNGIYNRGSIQSSSESDNLLSTSATAVPTNATGVLIGSGATINPYGSVPPPSGVPQVTTAGWDTTAGSGSTTTTIVLGANASEVDGIYEGFVVTVGAETRAVTDYVVVRNDDGSVVSKTLTLDTALTTAPASGATVNVNVPNTAVALSPSASDISGIYNGFTITAGSETRIISDYTVIYDPVTLQPTMKIAHIKSVEGVGAPWNSPPIHNAPVSISTSALLNLGSIAASMGGDKGGVVTAIMIQPGGTLPSITNYGAIDAIARTTDTSIGALSATAINDQSGTLNTIVNHGRILAQATTLDNGAQVAVAADLSHSAVTQRLYVLSGGDVTGDVIFGSAAVDTVNPQNQNKLIIEGSVTRTSGNVTTVDHSTVFGAVRATNNGSLDIEVSRLGTGGTLRTSNTQATSLLVGSNGSVQFSLDKNTSSAPLISTTGNTLFASNSSISVTPTSFLPANGTYTLLSAGAGSAVHFQNFGASANLGSGSPFPFLFEGAFATANGTPLNVASGNITAQGLNLTLTRKTADQLGLQGNAAAIYEPLAAAALGDDEIGAALLRLTSAEQVNAAVGTTIPDIAGGMRALAVAMTDQATGVIGARQRSLLTAPAGTRNEFRFWGQEFYNIVGFDASDGQHGYGGAGQGVSIGVEWGALESGGRWGAGYTFFSSQEVEDHPRETKTNGDWNMLSAYGAWRINDFFVAPQVNVGMGDLKTRRTIIVGDVGRVARADTTSYLAAGGATAGYVIEVGNIDIIPTIAIDMMYLNQGAYRESGAGGAGLSLASQNQTSIRSFAGVIGQGSYAFNEGTFMPQLLAGWSHEFANDPITIDGSFESSPGSPFRLVGPTLDANKVVGGMSLGYVMRNWSAGFSYDAAASRGSLAQSATFSISSRF